jgi:ribosomal protein S1
MVKKSNNDDDFFGTPLSAAMTTFNLEVGDIVLGRVSQIDEDYVYVSTGFKSEGRIPTDEFRIGDEQELNLKVDDEVEVMVDRISHEEIFLSYGKVREQRRWDELVKKNEDGESIDAIVRKMVKGGYRLDVGVGRHAFLPASHWGPAPPQTNEEIEGQTIRVNIIEIDKGSGNIVVSRKDLVEKEMAEKKEEIFSTLQVDSIIEGKVTRLTNFGAFVDVGGFEGLVHISELAWSRVGHPSHVLNCGDTVSVKVLDLDEEKKKISLSIKQARRDPWETIDEVYSIDQEIEGAITRVVKYGMFVRIDENFEGLLHNSEMPSSSEGQSKKAAGDIIKVKVLNLDKVGHRIKLGLSDSGSASSVPSDMERYIDNGKSGVAIGDVFSGLDENKAETISEPAPEPDADSQEQE